MTGMFGVRGCALGLVALLACSGEGDGNADAGAVIADSGVDAGATAQQTVEIGTGEDTFVPLATGEVVAIVAGTQGGGRFEGYHIVSSVRVRGFVTQNISVTFSILAADRAVLATQNRVFPSLEPSQDASIAYGVKPRLSDCCLAEGAELILRVEVQDSTGATGSDERTVRASDRCEDPGGGGSICPL